MISTVIACIVVFIGIPIGLGFLIQRGMGSDTPVPVLLDRRILPHRVLPMENNVAADPVSIMKNTEFLISEKNLERAKALMANSSLTESISVEQAMKNGPDVYDVSKAVKPFKTFVDRMYGVG